MHSTLLNLAATYQHATAWWLEIYEHNAQANGIGFLQILMLHLKYKAASSIEKWDQTWTAVSTYQVSSAGLDHIFRLQHSRHLRCYKWRQGFTVNILHSTLLSLAATYQHATAWWLESYEHNFNRHVHSAV